MDGNYVALSVTLVIWIGLAFMLMRMDSRVRRLEEKNR